MAVELSMSMTMEGSDSGWVRGTEVWMSEVRKEEEFLPGTWKELGSMGVKDMVAVARGGGEGGADKVGSSKCIVSTMCS